MHVRQQIRERLLQRLTGLATTGANVTANRVYPYDDDKLPALNIVTIPRHASKTQRQWGRSRDVR